MSVTSSTDSLVIVGDETPQNNEESNAESCPPKMQSMNVVSNVRNRYARTIVTSKYCNPATRAQQATFSIVLPDTAFIAKFVMEINEKKYEAYVKEKKEAKQEYDAAVSRGRAAAHVAVSARDSNKFTVSVNVEPQSDVTFILTYEELLVRKHSKYEMVVNLHPEQFLDSLDVHIYINETRPIINVATPAIRSGNKITDKITKNEYSTIRKNTDGVVHVSFHPTIEQQKEIATALTSTEENPGSSEQSSSNGISGQFVVEYDVERDPQGGEVLLNDGYFVHFFAPTELKPIPKHVIFILDVSGSMGGRKLKQLKEAMKVILNELNPEDYFNLVKFSSYISVLNKNYLWNKIDNPESKLPQSFEVNETNIKSIQYVIDHITDEDCTNIYDALIIGLRLTSRGISHLEETDIKHKLQPIIVFLTDGQPTVRESDPKKIIQMVEKRNDCDNKSAIFTLAFGDDADKEFLKELAIQNSGFLRNIYEAADASLQLQDFYKQISSPLLTNVNFKYPDEVKEVTNHKFDILFDGSEFVVAGKVDDMVDGFVFVECLTVDGANKFCPSIITICPNPEVKEEYGNLERLWAYMTIKQLLDKKYEDTSDEDIEKNPDENKTRNKSAEIQALDLALKYSFVTPITSLVVVKPDEPAVEEQLLNADDQFENYRDAPSSMCFLSSPQDDFNLDQWCADMQCAGQSECEDDEEDATTHCKGLYEGQQWSFQDYTNYEATSNYAEKIDNFKKKSNSLSGAISQFFKKSKVDDDWKEFSLISINTECNVINRVAAVTERRKYANFEDKPHEKTITIDLPKEATFAEFLMEIEAILTAANGRDKKHAKREYKEAVSNGWNAALVNNQDSNKISITLHIMPHTEVTFALIYTQRVKSNNGKYVISIKLHREADTDEMNVNVNLIEATPIKNVEILPLRSQNETMSNEYVTMNRINDNEVHVKFNTTAEQQEEIAGVLKSTDGNFSGELIVEFEVEPDLSAKPVFNVVSSFTYLVITNNN